MDKTMLDAHAVDAVKALATKAAGVQSVEIAETKKPGDRMLVLDQGKLVDVRALFRKDPAANAVVLASLTGVLDYVDTNVDKLELPKLLAIVQSPTRVELVSALRTERDRETLVVAELQGEGFKFGTFYEQQNFVIGLMTRFVPTDARDTLVAAVAKIVAGETITVDDDGIGQTVTMQVNAGLRTPVVLKPIQHLQPFRTFREVEQPESPFLLRTAAVKDQQPTLALFNADGGEWANTARVRIKEFLDLQLSERKVKLAVLA
jgi:hypothetical protein